MNEITSERVDRDWLRRECDRVCDLVAADRASSRRLWIAMPAIAATLQLLDELDRERDDT